MSSKVVLAIFVMVLFQEYSMGQCVIDAGLDRNVCPEETFEGAMLYGQVISCLLYTSPSPRDA